jgi:hypothetical protein
MTKVQYNAGTSRYSENCVDYMLVVVDGIELYAEAINPTWDKDKEEFADETATYDELKASILEQAAEKGIDADKLKFWYD